MEAVNSGASTRGEFGRDGWVKTDGVMPLSLWVSDGVVSAPASSVGLSSWGWKKSALGVEKYSSAVLKL